MRLKDNGHRFVMKDKETDKIKAQQQIAKSSFQEINNNPTKELLEKVEKWKEYIVNYDARPGKNSTLYKTHKSDIPITLLTTGCNTMI